jgi:hypothetical protein
MARQRSKRQSNTRGGDLGIIGTAAVPLSLLVLSKLYRNKSRLNTSTRRGRHRRVKSRRRYQR